MSDICRDVLEDECVISWVPADLSTREGVKKAINDLCCFAVQVATDPRTNGGYSLQKVPEGLACCGGYVRSKEKVEHPPV